MHKRMHRRHGRTDPRTDLLVEVGQAHDSGVAGLGRGKGVCGGVVAGGLLQHSAVRQGLFMEPVVRRSYRYGMAVVWRW